MATMITVSNIGKLIHHLYYSCNPVAKNEDFMTIVVLFLRGLTECKY